MSCTLEKIIMVEVSRYINLSEFVNDINFFCDVNSTLYTVTKVRPKTSPGFY